MKHRSYDTASREKACLPTHFIRPWKALGIEQVTVAMVVAFRPPYPKGMRSNPSLHKEHKESVPNLLCPIKNEK
jgi:hypothetical protein